MRMNMLNFGMIDTLDPLSQKLENENVELEFQVLNYAKENAHLKTTYKNLFDFIFVARAQTKTIINSLQDKLHDTIYENAKLRSQLFDKASEQKDTTKCTSVNTQFCLPKIDVSHRMSKPVTSNSVPTTKESKVVENDKVISPGMFRIVPRMTSREDKFVPINKVKASVRTNSITVSQPHVITKKDVNSNSNGLYSTGIESTAKTRRSQPMSNTKNDRNDKSEVVCAMCKQYLITANHDLYVLNYVNDMNSCGKKQKENVSKFANQKKHKPQVKKPKKVGSTERLASPKPSKPRSCLSWSPTGRIFDLKGKIIASSESESQSDCSKGDNACISNPQEPTRKRFPKSTFSLAGYSNLFMERRLGMLKAHDWKSKASHKFRLEVLGNHLEVAFRRNTCFIRNLKGVGLLKGNRTTNLYTINLHEMASASPICLMAHATSTKSWLWHQRLSHLNFYTINDLAKNDLVTGLPKFKYHNEHLCPLCEQGKSKKASHPPKPVPNSKSKDEAPEEIKNLSQENYSSIESSSHYYIGKLGAKGDNGFFIGYSTNSCAYRVYNQRTKKIIETMNVTFDELSTMVFEQRSSKPGLQIMTFGQIGSGLDLTYAPSTITTQQPTEHELDLLFEAMYDDYIGVQLSAAPRTVPAAQTPLVLQTLTTPITIADTAPTPTNSSSQATNFPNTPQDVDELETQQQHVQQQDNQAPLQPK
ncbi:retrovirus-related pol polyprotein from transposon TNT 1-94, partial [Tanacetum coccineum]